MKIVILVIIATSLLHIAVSLARIETTYSANERLTIQVEQLTEANHRLVEEIGETLPDWGKE